MSARTLPAHPDLRHLKSEAKQLHKELAAGEPGAARTRSYKPASPERRRCRCRCVAPIGGGGDPELARLLRDTPLWAFHGGADRVVSPYYSRAMIDNAHADPVDSDSCFPDTTTVFGRPQDRERRRGEYALIREARVPLALTHRVFYPPVEEMGGQV